MASKTYIKTISGVGTYKQYTGSWATSKTSCGGTMSQEGCVITSFTNLLNSHGNSSDPGSVLATLKTLGYDCLFNWTGAGTKYNLTATRVDGGFNTIKASLFDEIVNKGRSVLIDLGAHTVAANGFNGTLTVYPDPDTTEITPSMIKVSDPGSGTRTTLADTIAAYGGIDVKKIVKYS